MRTVNFRDDVLFALAYKIGMTPATDLLVDQATTYTSFINTWVRRLYDRLDWPEWTVTEQRTPDANHFVNFDQAGQTPIGRVFKVYLRDPTASRGPLETPFRLNTNGIYCGLEHGTNVWIKFGLRAPEFTATPWNAITTYSQGNLVFDSVGGNCYSSVQNAPNTNNQVTNSFYWAIVPFPFALCDAVVRGAYSDALRDDGQTDKAVAEEQAAAALVGERGSTFTSADYDPLTGQQPPPGSRYRSAAAAAAA